MGDRGILNKARDIISKSGPTQEETARETRVSAILYKTLVNLVKEEFERRYDTWLSLWKLSKNRRKVREDRKRELGRTLLGDGGQSVAQDSPAQAGCTTIIVQGGWGIMKPVGTLQFPGAFPVEAARPHRPLERPHRPPEDRGGTVTSTTLAKLNLISGSDDRVAEWLNPNTGLESTLIGANLGLHARLLEPPYDQYLYTLAPNPSQQLQLSTVTESAQIISDFQETELPAPAGTMVFTQILKKQGRKLRRRHTSRSNSRPIEMILEEDEPVEDTVEQESDMPPLDENSLKLMLEGLLDSVLTNVLGLIKSEIEQLKLRGVASGERSTEERVIERKRTLERLKSMADEEIRLIDDKSWSEPLLNPVPEVKIEMPTRNDPKPWFDSSILPRYNHYKTNLDAWLASLESDVRLYSEELVCMTIPRYCFRDGSMVRQ